MHSPDHFASADGHVYLHDGHGFYQFRPDEAALCFSTWADRGGRDEPEDYEAQDVFLAPDGTWLMRSAPAYSLEPAPAHAWRRLGPNEVVFLLATTKQLDGCRKEPWFASLLPVLSKGRGRPPLPTADYCLLRDGRVRWDGEPVALRKQLRKLLDYLLSRDDYPVPARDVQFAVWGDNPPDPHHFANTLGFLNRALEPIAFPWKWFPEGEAVRRC